MIGPIHPGVTLREDFMEPYGLSANSLAKALGIPQNRVSDIVRGRRGITADTALRLEHFSYRCSDLIAGVADIVSALRRGDGRQGRPDRRPQVSHRAGRQGSQVRFEFGKDLFNGIEVRTVRWQVEELAPTASIAWRTPATLWHARLSRTTRSPGWRVGARTCST